MAGQNNLLIKINQLIGDKIYSLRLGMGLTRQQLASKIGVSHQQLIKYEKGTNRITTGRLVLIAEALSTNVLYFFKDLDVSNEAPQITQHQRMCIEVSRNFMKIENSQHQEAINILVKSLSE